jgi:hypothetical protein
MIRHALLASALVWGWLGAVACAGEPYHTPLAGDAYTTTLFGRPVNVEPRDRTNLTALNFGVYWVPDIKEETVSPFGALYLWRNLDHGTTRFRGVINGVYDDIRYITTPAFLGGAEAVLTFANYTVPVAQSEYVEGVEIDDSLYWFQAQFGFGLGYSTLLAPGHQDNIAEASLTYEPGFLAFSESSDTPPGYLIPRNTYEGRVHLRLRADAMTRNVMELAHRGRSGGMDLVYGHRAHWEDWGGDSTFGLSDGASHRNWLAASAYAVAAGGVPFVESERHRLIARLHAGIGSDLDRFSSFRLGGGPGGDEAETLSRPISSGAAFNEFFTDLYGIASLEYRYELLFFLYLHLKNSVAWIDRYRFQSAGLTGPAADEIDCIPLVTLAVTTGFVWHSELDIWYTHAFGVLRDIEGNPRFGGNALVISWAREF